MQLTPSRTALIIGSVAVLAVGGWLVYEYFHDGPRTGNTPVTVGEGSIVIATHPDQPFFSAWRIVDGAASFPLSQVIETIKQKSWEKVYVNSVEREDCTGKDDCQIIFSYSEGTTVSLSHVTNKKGMRVMTTRVLGDYAPTATVLTHGGNEITLLKATLTKTSGGTTKQVDLCTNVAKCKVTVDYK